MTVCIHFMERSYRMAYEVTIDEYTVLSIGGGFKLVNDDSLDNYNFLFQAGKSITPFPTFFYDRTKTLVAPVFNVVIKVNEGNITDVLWYNQYNKGIMIVIHVSLTQDV